MNAFAGADVLEDGFPHGTVEGFRLGCKGGACPEGAAHGLSCKRAKQLSAGDYQFQKLVRAGRAPGEIAGALGLIPETHDVPVKKRKVVVPDDGEQDLQGESLEDDTDGDEAMASAVEEAPRAAAQAEPTKDDEKRRRAEIRAWAAENGIHVGEKGRIAQAVVIGWLNDDPTLRGTRAVDQPTPASEPEGAVVGVVDPEPPDRAEPDDAPQTEPVVADPPSSESSIPSLRTALADADPGDVVNVVIHGGLPDMETVAELFNDGYEEATRQSIEASLLTVADSLDFALRAWDTERARREAAEARATAAEQALAAHRAPWWKRWAS